MGGCAILGAVFAWGLGVAFEWSGVLLATALGALAVMVGAMASIGLIALVAGEKLERLGAAVVVAGAVRMFVSLSVGLVLWKGIGADGRSFWTSYLIVGLLCLMFETWWGMAASRHIGEGRVESGVTA
jgi:hypothetical protein